MYYLFSNDPTRNNLISGAFKEKGWGKNIGTVADVKDISQITRSFSDELIDTTVPNALNNQDQGTAAVQALILCNFNEYYPAG